jgi:hypothetical protein
MQNNESWEEVNFKWHTWSLQEVPLHTDRYAMSLSKLYGLHGPNPTHDERRHHQHQERD